MKRACALPLLRLLFCLLLCAFAFRFAARRWDPEQAPEIYDISLSDRRFSGLPEDALTLRVTGIGLYRVNTLWVDGRRVPVLHSEAQGYTECYLCVAASVLPKEKACRLRVGKRYPFPIGELYRSGVFVYAAK